MSTEALPSADQEPEAVVLPEQVPVVPVDLSHQVTDPITEYHRRIADSFPRSPQGGWGEPKLRGAGGQGFGG